MVMSWRRVTAGVVAPPGVSVAAIFMVSVLVLLSKDDEIVPAVKIPPTGKFAEDVVMTVGVVDICS